MSKSYKSLAGMFFTESDGDNYCTGEVIAQVLEDTYLVRYDGVDVKTPQELVSIDQMLSTTNDGFRQWHFFADRAELKAWIEWLESPPAPRVIHLVKK